MLPYAVVKFPVDNTIGVICTKWLDAERKFCRYPTSKIEFLNMSRILKKECDPSADWETYPVVILGQYETFAEAKRNEQKAEDTSNLSDDEEDLTKKRKRKPNSKYEESSEESSPSPPPPKKLKNGPPPPKHPPLTSFSSPSPVTPSLPIHSHPLQSPISNFNNIQIASNIHNSPYPDNYNYQVPAPHQSHHSLYPDFTQQTPPSSLEQPIHRSLFPDYSQHTPPTSTNNSHQHQQTGHSPSDFNSSHTQQPTYETLYTVNELNTQTSSKRLHKPKSDDIIDKINHLSSMMAAYNQRLDGIEKKLDAILESKVMDKENRAEENVFQFLPIKTNDGFDEYEEKLNDEGFRKSCVKAMSSLGGPNPNSLTLNIVKCMLTDKVAEQFSLTGKKMGNVPAKRKFIGTKMCTSIFDAVRRRHKEASHEVIKNALKHWLQQATPRIQKREKRQVLAANEEESGEN